MSLWTRHGQALRGRLQALRGTEPAPEAPEVEEVPWAQVDAVDGEPAPLRLQVLNAAGVPRLALETGDRLRRWEVDALDRGNAPPGPFPETLLIVRGDRTEAVAALGERLGGVPVVLQRRPDLMLDATLVLGHDWRDYRWPD